MWLYKDSHMVVFSRSNVRLQARAALGASLCKPLFGAHAHLNCFVIRSSNDQFQSFAGPLFHLSVGALTEHHAVVRGTT